MQNATNLSPVQAANYRELSHHIRAARNLHKTLQRAGEIGAANTQLHTLRKLKQQASNAIYQQQASKVKAAAQYQLARSGALSLYLM